MAGYAVLCYLLQVRTVSGVRKMVSGLRVYSLEFTGSVEGCVLQGPDLSEESVVSRVYKTARRYFIESMAGYAVLCYLLQVRRVFGLVFRVSAFEI